MRMSVREAFVIASLIVACVWHASVSAQTPYSYSRSSSFDYYATGLLKTETVEPDTPQQCVSTTYTYDAYGNKTGSTTANCTGASGRTIFPPHVSSATYGTQTATVAGVSISTPAGTFGTTTTVASGGTTATSAKQQQESRVFDPRFGVAVSLTGPNLLPTSWVLDDFGRVVRETRADMTSVVSAYCFLPTVADLSSNSASCPTPTASEVPADAVHFVHSELRNTSDAKIGAFTRVYMDRAGHKLRTVTEPFDGASNGTTSLVVQDFIYNYLGVLATTTQPYFLDLGSSTVGGSGYGSTTTRYDVLGRPVEIAVSDAKANGGIARTTIAYGVLKITTTNDKGQTRTEEKNIDGKVVRVTDHLGAQMVYQYDAFGNLLVTKDALQNKVNMTYDTRGRKLTMSDPDSGLWKYDYNALGELVWQQNPTELAAGKDTTIIYDELGRMIQRTDMDYISYWSYDVYFDKTACSYGIGKLCETKTTAGIGSRKIVYDNKGRVQSQRTTVTSGPSFASSLTYDASTGRIASQTYPTGLVVGYGYTTKGYLEKLTLNTTATVGGASCASCATLWQALKLNAWGKVESETFGNGVQGKAKYEDLTGRVSKITAGVGSATNVEDYSLVWNSLNQLDSRIDAIGAGNGAGAVSEQFSYDGIGRLWAYEVSAPTVADLSRRVVIEYNALGSILTKSDVGAYSYPAAGSARPHAPLGVLGASYSARFNYDGNGNLICANGGTTNCPTNNVGSLQTLRYTSFNLPDSSNGLKGAGSTPAYTWAYDENRQRFKETRVAAGVTRTTYMLHPDNAGGLAFESEQTGSTYSQRHYLTGGSGTVGVLISSGALPTLSASQMAPTPLASIALSKAEYWHKDHLGSLVATTDQNAGVTARYAYDPFGKRRFTGGGYDGGGTLVADWSSAAGGTDRGFTGHEHLDDVGVIHMNGRTYDPRLGMFMQPDPRLQNPFNLQNYNRYGYCYNSPTNCTDPTGQFFGWDDLAWAAVAIWGAHEANIINTQTARALTSIAVAVYLGPQGGAFGGPGYGTEHAAIAGFASGSVANGSFKGGMQGLFSAVAFYQAGQVIGGRYLDGAKLDIYEAAALHGIIGCATSEVGGGKCSAGGLSAAFAKMSTPYVSELVNGNVLVGGIVSTIAGGTASVLGGGKFSNGASTAAFAYLFNCMASQCIGGDYSRKARFFHDYLYQTTICQESESGCMEFAQRLLACDSAPGQQRCIVPGAPDSISNLMAGNPASQYMPSENMIINGSLDGHTLHDGYVVRWIGVAEGTVSIYSWGIGVNETGKGYISNLAAWAANYAASLNFTIFDKFFSVNRKVETRLIYEGKGIK